MSVSEAQIEVAPDVIVTEAEPDQHLGVIYRVVDEWHQGTRLNLPPLDKVQVLRWILELIDSEHAFIALATLDGGKYSHVPAGAIAVALQSPMWSPQLMAYSHFFHVPAAHRRWDVPARLIDAAKAWSAAKQVPLVLNLVQGTRIGARPDQYYRLSDAQLVGGVFMYGLPEQQLEYTEE